MTATDTAAARPEAAVRLDDKYLQASGRVFITGVQALVRLVLDQRRLDTARGLDTAAFVSGYPGSPLGGVDLEFQRASAITGPAGVVLRPGLNEELAATAVAGTQLIDSLPGRRHDGVTAFWYGKNPGLDRAADAIRHANLAGTAPLGGAVAWIGDDPACKSSTLPSSCEPMIRSLAVPLLAPSTVSEIIELGLHAVALSRHSGLWAGLKIVADLADGSATIDLPTPESVVPAPDPSRPTGRSIAVGTEAVQMEQDLLERRIPLAVAYAREHRLNRVAWEPDRPRTAIVAAGLTYATTLRALELLGIDEAGRQQLGIRLVKLGMPWPLDQAEIRRLTSGVDEVIVVEEKQEFIEDLVKAALYRSARAPEVVGKTDSEGRPLLPAAGALDADLIADALAARCGIDRGRPRPRIRIPLEVHRSPYFCSGCPHNVSTRAADDQLVGVGIGCHIMVALDGHGRGRLVGMTQMGGEGGHWLGLAPFTDDAHYTQNLGDGTFLHSGSLAIRAAVAAGVSITYKLLHNDAVAMTGGQQAPGRMTVPALARLLITEGAARVVVATPEPESYRHVRWSGPVSVCHRDDLERATRDLAATPGVTVLIYDDRCAAEERRLRKRGRVAAPAERVWINSRVCEGCGDCASKSSCLSLTPSETPFGRRMAVHQGSCNQDFSCVKGDCPSFVMVTPGPAERPTVPELPVTPAEPQARRHPDGETLIRMPGIGGTGVVTVSHVLQMAAHLDGRHAGGLEQTGLAQKGGQVVSDIRISDRPIDGSVKAPARAVDVLLGFDSLAAAEDANLAAVDPGRTVAVVSTGEVPCASMIRDRSQRYPAQPALARIGSGCRADSLLEVPAQWLSERLFADHLPANMVLVGAAYQHGCLPVRAESVEQAITLNGAAVATNLAAFRWGRAYASDPEAVVRALGDEPPGPGQPETFEEATGRFAADLEDYQNRAYARRYLGAVSRVRRREAEAGSGDDISRTFARQLYRLMAYKDEYEVARLHLHPEEKERLVRQFGPGARTRVMLHPPALRAIGLNRKISLGVATIPSFTLLRAARRLRGTALDPFGRSALRRTERDLIDEYLSMMERAVDRLGPDNRDLVLELAAAPEEVRGYEEVKLAGVARFRERAAGLLARIDPLQ